MEYLYAAINFRGVMLLCIPAVWEIVVPPRIHVFLWLLSQNKILIRGNLNKRQKVDDLHCLFCSESESTQHLFCQCDITKLLWSEISEMPGIDVGGCFESIARL